MRRGLFYDHIWRMRSSILNTFDSKQKTTDDWYVNGKKDVEKIGLKPEDT